MTGPATRRRLSPAALLGGLALVTVAVAIFTPEAPGMREGGRSSYSSGPDGIRMMFELAERMGWEARRRVAPLDSVPALPSAVHLVVSPAQALGAHEVNRLLSHVRRGGGLIFSVDDADEIADSLGLATGRPSRMLETFDDAGCPPREPFDASFMSIPPETHQIVWRRPAPGPTVPLVKSHSRLESGVPVIVGFRLGAGRVVAVSSSAVFTNQSLRECRWGADLATARVLEYVRPGGVSRPTLVFDEYHHGFGMRGGTLKAIAGYLSHTSSGRFLAQALIAGLLLVLAKAPRPVRPRDPVRIARRSPLEHADALGQAYSDVGATRTMATRLVSGLRRRVGRAVPGAARLDDPAFLAAIAGLAPALAPRVSVVERALREPITAREVADVGAAVRDIEGMLDERSTVEKGGQLGRT